MKWVLQDNIFTEPFFDKLVEFLKRMEIPHEIVKAVPFTGEMLPEPKIDGPAIAIGSYSFTNRAKAIGWNPGTWTNENFDYRVWSKKWRGRILNEGTVYKFGEIPFTEEPFFLRPCADDKVFAGMVYTWDEYHEWKQKVIDLRDDNTTIDLEYDTPVVVAPPRDIVSEYRFVIVNGVIVTGSLYKSGRTVLYKETNFELNEELHWFVWDTICQWTPADVFCLDIAQCNGEYKVLEMGNFNSAGLYDCDVQKIVIALENMVHRPGDNMKV